MQQLRARRWCFRYGVLACCLVGLLSVRRVHAQELRITHENLPEEAGPSLATTLGYGAAGALTALLLHESGHVAANLALGNVPQLRGTMLWGFVPFFVISPALRCGNDYCIKRDGHRLPGGPNGAYFIAMAGFTVQNVTNELLLTGDANLGRSYAPFRKGILGFNIFLSTMYAVGAFTKLEARYGDLSAASRRSRIDEAWLATLLLVPTALDVYRYLNPSRTWSAWAARSGAATLFGLTFVF
jgi:hypothetical protein